jgi:HD-like signal output (HDOD) protein
MRRILFVDDDTEVLDGLARALRPRCHDWEMAFVSSAREALSRLEAAPYDVLVADVRMPEIGGVRLLELARQRFPSVIRVVLSGFFEREAALKAAGLAHQYLAKPCDPQKLWEAIESLCRLGPVFPEEAARRVIAAVGPLPVLPRTAVSLVEALHKPDVLLEEAARILRQDAIMERRILDLICAPGFGLFCEMIAVQRQVASLELGTLSQLVTALQIFDAFRPCAAGFSAESLQRHASLAARIAAVLPAARETAAAAVTAALLHDSGLLVLAARRRETFECAAQVAVDSGRPLPAVEQELFGTTHPEVGGYLLALWGLPRSIVDAVCRHHRPVAAGIPGVGLDVLAVTHVADALAAGQAPLGIPCEPGIDRAYLEALGVLDRLPAWRKMAAAIAGTREGEYGE